MLLPCSQALIADGKSVLIASYTNSAVDHMLLKLQAQVGVGEVTNVREDTNVWKVTNVREETNAWKVTNVREETNVGKVTNAREVTETCRKAVYGKCSVSYT